jgi:IPT/TIG domain
MAGIPVVFSLAPNNGPVAAGNVVTVNGLNLTGASAVKFISVAGSATPPRSVAGTNIAVLSDNVLNVTTPLLVAGNYDVIVTATGGTSLAVPAGIYTAS